MAPAQKKLTIGPLDLEWLAQTLKLDDLISEKPALEQILDSFPAIQLEGWPRDHEVIREGDRGDDIFVVYTGRLSAWRRGAPGPGVARRLGRLAPGDLFGEIGFLMKSARSATVRTDGDCKIFRLPSEEFSRILRKHKALSRWVKGVACSRLTKLFGEE